MHMPTVTVVYALILIALGVGSYVLSGGASITALIPAFFGGVMLVFGGLGFKESLRKHMMHAASAFALLGIAGTASGIVKVVLLLTGGEVERPMASVVQATMAVLSVGFLALCVRSFIQARRAREAGDVASA